MTDVKYTIKIHNTENVSRQTYLDLVKEHKRKYKMFSLFDTKDETFPEGDWSIEYDNYRIIIEFKFEDLLGSLNNHLLVDELQRMSNGDYTNRFLIIGGQYDSVVLARVIGLVQHFRNIMIFIHDSPKAAIVKALYLIQYPGLKDKNSTPVLVYTSKSRIALCENKLDGKGKYYRVQGTNARYYIDILGEDKALHEARAYSYKMSMTNSIASFMAGISMELAEFMVNYEIDVPLDNEIKKYKPFYTWERIAKRSKEDIENLFYEFNKSRGTDRHEYKKAEMFFLKVRGKKIE